MLNPIEQTHKSGAIFCEAVTQSACDLMEVCEILPPLAKDMEITGSALLLQTHNLYGPVKGVIQSGISSSKYVPLCICGVDLPVS